MAINSTEIRARNHIITIFTDASFCDKLKAGGWACWIKYGSGQVITASGAFKTEVQDSTDAEMRAIVNALHVVLKEIRPKDAAFIMTTDSQNAIKRITGTIGKKRRRKCKHLQDLADKVNAMVPEDCLLIMRKVKAHSKADGVRSHVNGLVDRAARKALRAHRRAVRSTMPPAEDAAGQIHTRPE